MLCQIQKTVSNSPLISNRMKKRNIFSWNLLQTISVISPPSPATPPIRGGHKSGAVPAYLDSPGTPAYWSLTVHCSAGEGSALTVEKSRGECTVQSARGEQQSARGGGWWPCRKWRWSLLCCNTRSASNQLYYTVYTNVYTNVYNNAFTNAHTNVHTNVLQDPIGFQSTVLHCTVKCLHQCFHKCFTIFLINL